MFDMGVIPHILGLFMVTIIELYIKVYPESLKKKKKQKKKTIWEEEN